MTTTINHSDDTATMLVRWTTPLTPTPRSPNGRADHAGSLPPTRRGSWPSRHAGQGREGSAAPSGGPLLVPAHRVAPPRDRGAEEALARPAGRQVADPRDKEIARLKKDKERLTGELDKARKVVEVQGKL